MKVYQVRIDIAGQWLLKDHPSAKDICKKLDKKIDPALFKRMTDALFDKGWTYQPLPSLVVLNLGDPYGHLSISTLDLDVIE